MDVDDLKKDYGKFVRKYKLPSFEALNRAFEIEKVDPESDILMRQVRKHMMEKIANSLSFVEMLMSPMNAPRMYQAYTRMMTADDRSKLEAIYKAFAELIIHSLEREIIYDEKMEAATIDMIFKTWNSVAEDFSSVFKSIRSPKDVKVKKERSYFG